MKKSREEDLARRYCEYLGLMLDVTRCMNGKIRAVKVHSTERDKNKPELVEYPSFKSFFFGNDNLFGMCEKIPAIYYIEDNAMNRINNMIIQASTLDELEMQLSARGF